LGHPAHHHAGRRAGSTIRRSWVAPQAIMHEPVSASSTSAAISPAGSWAIRSGVQSGPTHWMRSGGSAAAASRTSGPFQCPNDRPRRRLHQPRPIAVGPRPSSGSGPVRRKMAFNSSTKRFAKTSLSGASRGQTSARAGPALPGAGLVDAYTLQDGVAAGHWRNLVVSGQWSEIGTNHLAINQFFPCFLPPLSECRAGHLRQRTGHGSRRPACRDARAARAQCVFPAAQPTWPACSVEGRPSPRPRASTSVAPGGVHGRGLVTARCRKWTS